MREIGPGNPDRPIRTTLGRGRDGNGVRRKQLRARRPQRESLLRALAVDYVRRLRHVSSLEKLVLCTLACRRDCETLRCDLSYTALAADCAMSRRSAESAMHNHGVSLKGQQAVLGHTNPNITLLYAETNEESKCAAAEMLGNLIFPKSSEHSFSEPLHWCI